MGSFLPLIAKWSFDYLGFFQTSIPEGTLRAHIDDRSQSMANWFNSLSGSLPPSDNLGFISGREVFPNEIQGNGSLSSSQPFFELLATLRRKCTIDYKANFERALSKFSSKNGPVLRNAPL
jgi:hypothetical protein